MAGILGSSEEVLNFLALEDRSKNVFGLTKEQLTWIIEFYGVEIPSGANKGILLAKVIDLLKGDEEEKGRYGECVKLREIELKSKELEIERVRLLKEVDEKRELENVRVREENEKERQRETERERTREKEREHEERQREKEREHEERQREKEREHEERQREKEREHEERQREKEREHEERQREKEREHEERQREKEREHELQVLNLKKIVGSGSNFNIASAIKLVPLFNEDDVTEFFTVFEKIVNKLKWPKEMWTTLVQCRFLGKAQKLYITLSEDVMC